MLGLRLCVPKSLAICLSMDRFVIRSGMSSVSVDDMASNAPPQAAAVSDPNQAADATDGAESTSALSSAVSLWNLEPSAPQPACNDAFVENLSDEVSRLLDLFVSNRAKPCIIVSSVVALRLRRRPSVFAVDAAYTGDATRVFSLDPRSSA